MKGKWKSESLGKVAQVFNGKTPSKSEKKQNGYPVLKIKDISADGFFRGKFESFVDTAFADKFSDKKVKKGDTLILNAAHNAEYVASKTYFAETPTFESLATGEWLIVRPDADYSYPSYIHHWINFQPTRQSIQELVNGIHLYPKDIARLSVPLPPLPEQKRIAAILDAADAIRVQRKAAIAKLDELARSVFLEMFGDPVRNEKGWEQMSLNEEILFLTSGSRGWAKYHAEQGSAFIKIQNVKESRLDFSTVQYVRPPETQETKRTKVQEDDLLVSITADLGRTAVVDRATAERGAYINQHLALVRLKQKRLLPLFTSVFLESPAGEKQFAAMNQSAVKAGLNFDSIKRLSIIAPEISLQQQFIHRINGINSLKLYHRSALAREEALFASLQHRAFAGEL